MVKFSIEVCDYIQLRGLGSGKENGTEYEIRILRWMSGVTKNYTI